MHGVRRDGPPPTQKTGCRLSREGLEMGSLEGSLRQKRELPFSALIFSYWSLEDQDSIEN